MSAPVFGGGALKWTRVPGKIAEGFISGPWRVYFHDYWRVSLNGADLKAGCGRRAGWRTAADARSHVELRERVAATLEQLPPRPSFGGGS